MEISGNSNSSPIINISNCLVLNGSIVVKLSNVQSNQIIEVPNRVK